MPILFRDRIRKRTYEVVNSSVIPALQRLRNFIVEVSGNVVLNSICAQVND